MAKEQEFEGDVYFECTIIAAGKPAGLKKFKEYVEKFENADDDTPPMGADGYSVTEQKGYLEFYLSYGDSRLDPERLNSRIWEMVDDFEKWTNKISVFMDVWYSFDTFDGCSYSQFAESDEGDNYRFDSSEYPNVDIEGNGIDPVNNSFM
jgi:hypothetical protein